MIDYHTIACYPEKPLSVYDTRDVRKIAQKLQLSLYGAAH